MTAPNDNTPLAIIADAYFDAGLTQEGQDPNSEQIVRGMRKLTDVVNLWQTQGLKLWLQQDVTIPLVAGQNLYSLGPSYGIAMTKPLRVTEAYYLQGAPVTAGSFVVDTTYTILSIGTTDFTAIGAGANQVASTFTASGVGSGTGTASTGTRRPLTVLSREEFTNLSQTNTRGEPNSYFVDKQQLKLDVYIWLTPDSSAASSGTVHLITQTQVTGIVLVTDTMNFPIEWRIALRWGLADELATGQPQAIMDRCQQRALMYRTVLEDWDVEDAPTRFTPDSRGPYNAGAFR